VLNTYFNEYVPDRLPSKLNSPPWILIYVTSGVPHGSHLGPLLFTLFINDLLSIITRSRVRMYADDVKFCFSYNGIASGYNLQSDIDCLQGWCEYNLINWNCLKCNVMNLYRGTHFKRGHSTIYIQLMI